MDSLWTHTQATGSAAALNASLAPKPGNGAANRWMPGASPATRPAAQSGAAATSQASTTASGSTDSGSSITANDFLTLLVTEMQNQDPTADSDPNEYINQLVQINSLEQLVSINQDLETVLGAASTGSTSAGMAATQTKAARAGAAHSQTSPHDAVKTQAPAAAAKAQRAGGNLSAPKDSHAATSVSHGLVGPGRGKTGFHALRDIPRGYLAR